jgi:RNA polymerase sigma factor (sigma-70 family)
VADEEGWQRLIDGLRAGDSQVEREFWEQYGQALFRVAERRLSPQMQARFGPEDVVQSVCRTFLRRARAGEFQLADCSALWKVLCVITLTKVREQVRFHRREKRSVDHEVRLPAPSGEKDDESIQLPDPHAEPAEAVAFADQMQALLAMLDEQERQVVGLKLQDLTNEEIARQLNLSERTIRRTLKRVEEKLGSAVEEG